MRCGRTKTTFPHKRQNDRYLVTSSSNAKRCKRSTTVNNVPPSSGASLASGTSANVWLNHKSSSIQLSLLHFHKLFFYFIFQGVGFARMSSVSTAFLANVLSPKFRAILPSFLTFVPREVLPRKTTLATNAAPLYPIVSLPLQFRKIYTVLFLSI